MCIRDSITGAQLFFIAFECNPLWEEIANELMPGQKAKDWQDLTAQIFYQELIKLVSVVT